MTDTLLIVQLQAELDLLNTQKSNALAATDQQVLILQKTKAVTSAQYDIKIAAKQSALDAAQNPPPSE